MKKILLLSAAAVALTATAETYTKSEGFAYNFAEGFKLEQAGEGEVANTQYPAEGLQAMANMAEGWGTANVWFTGLHFDGTDGAGLQTNVGFTNDSKESIEEGMNKFCPVVAYPTEGDNALRMSKPAALGWIGFGNFNFAIPQCDEECRVRVVYTVDNTVANPGGWNVQKPLQIKLMKNADQSDPNNMFYGEQNEDFWTNPGWRVTDFVLPLNSDKFFLSILFDAGGLSLKNDVPFYVREVSVVKMSALKDYQAPEDYINDNDVVLGKMGTIVTTTPPELVTIAENAGVESVAVDANAPVEYFNLQGIRVAEPANGIFIRRQGDKTTKVAL
ncbi:MAG: hypothetical protein NC210_06365 [[Clostridium] fimetarium]|nr:hypothetical protein [Alistipes timonensis]MCM1406026.1 hypothetical protein [[Clostridium] fimetarium]